MPSTGMRQYRANDLGISINPSTAAATTTAVKERIVVHRANHNFEYYCIESTVIKGDDIA